MFHRLSYRISAYFVALMVVVMAVILLITTVLVSRNINKVIETRFNETRILLGQQLDNETRVLTTNGRVLSRAPRLVAAASTGDHETVLDFATTFHDQVESEIFTVIDETGHVLARLHEPDRWGDNVLADSLVVQALNGSSGSGLVIYGDEIYQEVVVPLISAGQMITGALIMGFQIDDKFAQVLKDLTGTDIAFYIDDKVVATSLDEDLQNDFKSLSDTELRTVKSKEPTFDVQVRGEPYRCAVIDLPVPRASYMVHRSIDNELGLRRQMLLFLIPAGLIFFIITSFISIILARSIARPISQLAELSSNVAHGYFDVSFTTDDRGEIGELAETFNFMTGRLREYLDELEENRRNLELKVEERTSELGSANKLLEQRNKRLRELSELALEVFDDKVDLYRAITDRASDMYDADMAILCREQNGSCDILSASGEDKQQITDHLIYHKVIESFSDDDNRDIVIHNVNDDVLKSLPNDSPVANYKTFMRAKVFVNDRKYGSLTLLSRKKKAFTSQDIEVLGILRRVLSAELEQKEWEQQILEYTAEVEKATRAKSEFLANMSHELRTPLNAIIGFSELLGQLSFGELNEKQSRYVVNILSSGNHLLTLINDILDLSKVEAGMLEFSPERFSITEALEAAESLIRGYAGKKSISIDFSVDEKLGGMYADLTRFKQILYNILSNAVKFTPEEGKVSLNAQELEDRSLFPETDNLEDGKYLMISVTDTGMGIKPEDHDLIWGEFRQVESAYTRQQEGTGLGLALTRRLIEKQNGAIWFDSEPGKMTTFYVVLPFEAKKPEDVYDE
ncbi:ATP-binding protein [Candidatus Latescibacterota bacterium]